MYLTEDEARCMVAAGIHVLASIIDHPEPQVDTFVNLRNAVLKTAKEARIPDSDLITAIDSGVRVTNPDSVKALLGLGGKLS